MFKPVFIMLVGLPGSGKSMFANELEAIGFSVHSSDKIREELFGSAEVQSDNDKVFKIIYKRIKCDLKNGKSAVMDATNISSKRRRAFLSEISKIECYKTCIVIATTIERCKKNNKKRERKVPEYVIDRMYHNFEFPGYFEGWDYINLVYQDYDDYKNYSLNNIFEIADKFNQKNSHHTKTLGEHMELVGKSLLGDTNLSRAGLLHDIGKIKTQTFMNKKGEKTKEAHYYSHQNVGAYDSMFYLQGINQKDLIDICTLIQWHMEPYFWVKESTKDKYKRIWGEELFNRIMRLHEADMNGK